MGQRQARREITVQPPVYLDMSRAQYEEAIKLLAEMLRGRLVGNRYEEGSK